MVSGRIAGHYVIPVPSVTHNLIPEKIEIVEK